MRPYRGLRAFKTYPAIVFLEILASAGLWAKPPLVGPLPPSPQLHLEPAPGDLQQLLCRFSEEQVSLLEKLNRGDRDTLVKLETIVVPGRWYGDERIYSPVPEQYPPAEKVPKVLLVHQPQQVFGAYEYGGLVRWGPISSGGPQSPTPAGVFFLNWRSPGHRSTVNRDWFLRWYFNFVNRKGHSFHEYTLPGRPASHGCIRLLGRDAKWLYEWGDPWALGPRGWTIEKYGTPVLIVGSYPFDQPTPWRSPEFLSHGARVSLESLELSEAALLLAGQVNGNADPDAAVIHTGPADTAQLGPQPSAAKAVSEETAME